MVCVQDATPLRYTARPSGKLLVREAHPSMAVFKDGVVVHCMQITIWCIQCTICDTLCEIQVKVSKSNYDFNHSFHYDFNLCSYSVNIKDIRLRFHRMFFTLWRMIFCRKPNKSPKHDFSWVFTARVTFNKNVCETVFIIRSVGGNALQVTQVI